MASSALQTSAVVVHCAVVVPVVVAGAFTPANAAAVEDEAAFIVVFEVVVGAFGKHIGGGNEGRGGAAEDFLDKGGLWHGESGSSEGETRPLVTLKKCIELDCN